jgi:hypothetical protein
MLADGSLAADPGISSWRVPAADGCCGRCASSSGLLCWSSRSAILPRSASTRPWPRRVAGRGWGPSASSFPSLWPRPAPWSSAGCTWGFSPQSQGQREQALAAFLPTNPNLGWYGVGPAEPAVFAGRGHHGGELRPCRRDTASLVNGQLIEPGVPNAAKGGGVVVSGEPAWLPEPGPP